MNLAGWTGSSAICGNPLPINEWIFSNFLLRFEEASTKLPYRRFESVLEDLKMAPHADMSFRKKLTHLVFPKYSELLDRMNWSARWTETVRESADCPRFDSREEMYDFLNLEFLKSGREPIDFFEFGVFQGESLRKWLLLNRHPQSRFYGFDSFQGLPTAWNVRSPGGTYSAGGKVPQIDDARVSFVVGWFQNSLPDFLETFESRNPLVIHNDSDLYSSTLYMLTRIHGLIPPGTLVIFDEFYDPLHEYRALREYTAAYMRKFQVVAATRHFQQAAVRIL